MYLWMYLRPTFKLSAVLLDIMGKSKEISQDLRKTIVDLHKSGSSLEAISKRLKVHIHLYKQQYASINTLGPRSCHTTQEGSRPLLQNHRKKARLWFATAHGKDRTFWRNVFWSDETNKKLFGHNDHLYVWRQSPDLNPIEHLWAELKKHVQERRPTNLTQLHQLCQEEGAKIHPTYCGKLVEGYPIRLAHLIILKAKASTN